MNPDLLPGPYGVEPSGEVSVSKDIDSLVQSQVAALLMSSPAFSEMSPASQDEMHANLKKITAYTAALIHDDWHQSRKLGQTPLVRTTKTLDFDDSSAAPPDATGGTMVQLETLVSRPLEGPDADDFAPRAASNVASVTQSTLNAIAFPAFVADLIKGTFNAIIDASIQQMEAFGELLSNVAKTVDEFMADNITDNSGRDWMAGAFPRNFKVEDRGDRGELTETNRLSEEEEARLRRTLALSEDTDVSDPEGVIVPAARRHLAQTRQQMLSSMVLMGLNRVIVTRGRIRAQMGFRIDSKDFATASSAEKFDTKTEAQAKYGGWFSPVSASVKTTVAYVSSTEKDSETELTVEANLTGEVDLQFKSDVFPLERFADAGVISTIQGNTANPAANQPITSTPP